MGDHGASEDEIRHVGGLGNITADADGHSKGSMTDHQVKLFEHEKYGSVVGRSMMIHAKEDDLGLGDNSKANEPGPPGRLCEQDHGERWGQDCLRRDQTCGVEHIVRIDSTT